MYSFPIRGFNPCESLLRHTPEQLRTFIRRMKKLQFNTIIIHYDYGWKRYQKLLLEECEAAGVNIILMTFGPRTFLSYSDWKTEWLAKQESGQPFTPRLECETWPCAFEEECLEQYAFGVRQWLKELPPEIKHIHMRAADGFMSCQCPHCRVLSTEEKWQPFVQIFVRTVQENRPDLKFETDVYVKRYRIPEDHASFRAMNSIMYDTFFRNGYVPLGSKDDHLTEELLQYAASEKVTDVSNVNCYHAARIREWTTAFPGKLYLHENTMGQSRHGIPEGSISTALKDHEFCRAAGVQGICYEAYEPGYSRFADYFELMSKSMRGEEVVYEPDEWELLLRKSPDLVFGDLNGLELERYVVDPLLCRQIRLYQACENTPSAAAIRAYGEFGFLHEDILDSLMIGFSVIKMGYRAGLSFENISERTQDMLSRRKLWDFMEEIPLTEDPRKVCRKLILEALEGVRDR